MFRVAVLLLAVSLGLIPLAAASPPTLERPGWTAGDTWTYDSNTTLIPGLALTGRFTSTVHGRVTTVVGGTSIDAYDVLLSASGTAAGVVVANTTPYSLTGAWILTGEERFEPVGLEMISYLVDLEVNGTANGLIPFTARVQNTTTYEITGTGWQYPLASGTSGTIAVRYNFTLDSYSSILPHIHRGGVGDWNVSFSIGEPVTLASPAGSFEVFPITETWPDGSVDRSFASARVGNDVRTESYTPQGSRTAITTLASYRYQALEARTFLGLTVPAWATVVTVTAAIAIAILVVRRMRRRKAQPPPSGPSGPELTSGPQGP